MQLSLELPDDIEAYRRLLLDRLFRRLKIGMTAAMGAELWSSIESIEVWVTTSLEDRRKIESATTRDQLDKLAHDLALTDEFMLPDEME